jgi:hypothetical protein
VETLHERRTPPPVALQNIVASVLRAAEIARERQRAAFGRDTSGESRPKVAGQTGEAGS